jgi:hypothetical protein
MPNNEHHNHGGSAPRGVAEPPWPFLMTPAQHREWARRARKLGRPDLAFHHDQLARVIENIAQREAEKAERERPE